MVTDCSLAVSVCTTVHGTPGELVFTTLTKTGMPLLRYRSGDVAALADPVPGSARTLRRMTKIVGRTDDMLVVRGVNVYPTEIEAVVLGDARVGPHYLIVEDRRFRHVRTQGRR